MKKSEQEAFYRCLPKGHIERLDNGNYLVSYHPHYPENRIWTSWRLVRSCITRFENAWETINEFSKQYGAEILTHRTDFYGPKTQISYRCLRPDCQCTWTSNYYVFKNMVHGWKQKNLSKKQLSLIACPKYRRSISKNATQASIFSKMSNAELLKVAHSTPHKDRKTNWQFSRTHSVLRNEMDKRIVGNSTLLRAFSKEQGWRVIRPELSLMSYEDWRSYLQAKGYKTLLEWKQKDSRALIICSTLHKETFYPLLKQEFFSSNHLFLNGIQYGSHSEKLVAKVLSHLNIDFHTHGQWGFSKPNSRRQMEYDFRFVHKKQVFVLEVWMCSRDNIRQFEEQDKVLQGYLAKRTYKINQIAKHHPTITLINIEARVYRTHGQKCFLKHIKDVLTCHGILAGQQLDLEDLYEGNETPLSQWTVDDFFNECLASNWRQFTDLPTSFQNHLRKHKHRQIDLVKRLALHYQYPLNTRYYLAPSEEVIKFCRNASQLQSKDDYISAHQKGKLPPGFPQNPTTTYAEINHWCEVWGDKPTVFLSYSEAKTLVQRFNFKSSGEYARARDSGEERYKSLYQVFKLPDHPITGYREWVNWRTFLGHDRALPWHLTAFGARSIQILSTQSVLAVSRYLKKVLNCVTKSQLRALSPKAADALNINPKGADIEIIVFGKTRRLTQTPKAIAKVVQEKHLTSERTWREARKRYKTYKRFPAKFYNTLETYNGNWSNVRKLLSSYAKE